MTDSNFSAIRARLKYETLEDFIKGYARFISGGGMFIPMRPSKLKPIGTTIRFQFLLGDRTTALLGEGVVLQVRAPDDANPRAPVGMLIKFTKLSQESKRLVDRIVQSKGAQSAPDFGESVDPAEHEKETDSGIDLTAAPTYDGSLDDAAQAASASASTPADSAEYEETADPADPADPFDEGLFVDSEGDEEEHLSDELEAEPEESDEADEQAEEDFDFDLGFETPVPVETPTQETEPESFSVAPDSDEHEVAEPHDADGEHEDDPTTREAPSASELEPPTAEAHVEADVEEDVPEAGLEEGSTAGPRKLAGTEGGLQVLAFDDMSDEELEEFQAFSFGEEEEEDFDSMFDGLFGGSEAEDDVFGGVFDGPESDNLPSREIELPDDAGDEGEELTLTDPNPVVPEAELGDPLAESEVEEDAIVFEESIEDDHADAMHDPERSEEVFELDDEFELEDEFEAELEMGDEESPVLALDDAVEPEDTGDGIVQEDYEDDLDALIDFQRAPGGQMAPEEAPAATQPEESNIQALLGSLDDEESEPELTLNIGGGSQDEDLEPEPDDEESLEALLASAQKEIEEKQGTPERPDGDILDQLLDGEELPPPPDDSPTFSLPQSSRKKKKGFLSKFFDKD